MNDILGKMMETRVNNLHDFIVNEYGESMGLQVLNKVSIAYNKLKSDTDTKLAATTKLLRIYSDIKLALMN